jgi:exopolyphosphatase/guanosine-5'-triphosphate,3'-diphosphate pyrophosphatase
MTGSSDITLMAAIDIGSSAIRMDIAEVRQGGKIHLLDSLKKGVQLGKDAFTGGSLSEETMRAACDTLRHFKKVMDDYGVARYRAVATSAVREAQNRDNFLDRVLMSTGLDVEVMDGSEENRLTYSAVVESMRGNPEFGTGKTLVVEIGGGHTDVTLLSGGEPVQSSTFPLGSIRLRASVIPGSGTHDQQTRLLKRQIVNILGNVKRSIDFKGIDSFVALGGDVRIAVQILKGDVKELSAIALPRDAFIEFVDSIARSTVDGLVQKYSLSYLDAETLTPTLLSYVQLLKETQAPGILVSDANIRSGILQDLAPAEPGKRIKKLTLQTLSAARNLGKKYQYDETHAERVRQLCELFFDALKEEHHLTETHRLYLQVAALLHDIGLFVSPRGHHKHSHYLIGVSDLFGLRQRELEIIGNIARYHRRGLPQRAHTAYVSLERDERILVSKLAAVLRAANALDKEHLQKIADLKLTREGDHLVLLANTNADLTMERMALASRSDLFTEVFGKKLLLREASRTS